jgi:hypothetical protein
MKPFTVLLLYPDYAAETFGHDTWMAHARARNSKDADLRARRDASNAIANQPLAIEHEDWHTLAVFEGHLEDVRP